MRRLYFDTETTGKIPKWNRTPDTMPYIVQLAAVLMDDDAGEVGSMNFIVNPGREIPEEAASIHGITTEKAERFGVPPRVALAVFSNLCRIADETVAHNWDFDSPVVLTEIDRVGGYPDSFTVLPRFCTMKAATPICRIPGRYGDFKWPKLQEAHQHFFGEEFADAHDALADVRACARVHRHLLTHHLEPQEP